MTRRAIASTENVLPPPIERYTLLGWVYKNLFNTWYNALLTFLAVGIIYAIGKPAITWSLEQARWDVVLVNMRLLMVGQYPVGQIWRIWLCLHLLAAVGGLSWGVWIRGYRLWSILFLAAVLGLAWSSSMDGSAARGHLIALDVIALAGFGLGRLGGKRLQRTVINLWIVYFPLVILIVRGMTSAEGAVPVVPSNLWGGLLLTFLLTVVGILFSFPLGVLLALGRRSPLPIIRWVSIGYIELIRGVPLVTILFMAQIMLPLFLPADMTVDRVLRAMVGIILFTAAYQAENIRGGLQAIPHGQYEAAHAMGLSGVQTTMLIILPQALRNVIPVLVGQFIALYKDTSLVAIVGLLDLLGIAKSIVSQPQFIGLQREAYLFVTAIYWLFSYFMAYLSQRLEVALGVGER
ncbi:MAG: amino acid ABC transporter permease [Anaerolineales bacterium]|nr:amino acid ABC transporter permease [Anaerolineales bacterium]